MIAILKNNLVRLEFAQTEFELQHYKQLFYELWQTFQFIVVQIVGMRK